MSHGAAYPVTQTPTPEHVPRARANGKIDPGWVDLSLLSTTVPTPDSIPRSLSTGKLDIGWIDITLLATLLNITNNTTVVGDDDDDSDSGVPDATYVLVSANVDLPNARLLVGTTNQVIVTDNGAGNSIVLSTPQDIHHEAEPTFKNLDLKYPGAIVVGNEIGIDFYHVNVASVATLVNAIRSELTDDGLDSELADLVLYTRDTSTGLLTEAARLDTEASLALGRQTSPILRVTQFADFPTITAPLDPPAGTRRVFVDPGTGELSVKTAAGGIVSLEAGGGGGAYTDEQAQDAIGTILVDSATIDFTYADATPSITAIVKDDSITFAKMQNITTGRVIGRTSGGTGDPEELAAGAGITISGGVIASSITQYTDENAQDSIGGSLTDSSTIDFTYDDAANTITAIVIDDSISNAKLRNSVALSVIGRSANSTGDPADIAAGTDAQVLRRSGTTLAFGAVDLSSANAVTNVLSIINGGTGLTAVPGANTYVIFNDAAAFGATAGLTFNKVSGVLTATNYAIGTAGNMRDDAGNIAIDAALDVLIDLSISGGTLNVLNGHVVLGDTDLTVDTASNREAITITGYVLTGANAQNMIDATGLWDTTGNPILLELAVQDTNSDTAARFIECRLIGVGSKFSVRKDGQVTAAGNVLLGGFGEFSEIAAPSTPAGNKLRLYAKDDGGISKLYYKRDDGTEIGPLSGGGSPGGATTNVQFNDGGAFGGDADFTWDKTANSLVVTGTARATRAGINVAAHANHFLSIDGGTLVATDKRLLDMSVNADVLSPYSAVVLDVTGGDGDTVNFLDLKFLGSTTFSVKAVGEVYAAYRYTGRFAELSSADSRILIESTNFTSSAFAALEIQQTWNNSGEAFDVIRAVITDTASNSGSNLISMAVSSVAKFTVSKAGAMVLASDAQIGGYLDSPEIVTPATPSANRLRLYAKDDSGVSKLFYLRDDGVEVGPLGAAGAGATPGGADTYVQFNDGGAFGGDAGFAFDKTTDVATLVGGLTVAQGTITADKQALSHTGTWNNAGVTFTAVKVNINTTTSGANSALLDLQSGGAVRFKVNKAGWVEVPSVTTPSLPSTGFLRVYSKASGGLSRLFYLGDDNTEVGPLVGPHEMLSASHTDALAAAVTRGAIIVGNGTPKWSRLAIGAANRVLRSDGTDAAWAQVVLSSDVTGTLAIANGGTSATTALGAFNALSPLTTRGDLLTRDATNNVRLAVGAANRVLRSNGTDAAWGQVVLTTDVTGVLPEANGGTNQSSFAQGDLLYASAANTLAKLAKNTTASRYLANTGSSNAPTWDRVNLQNGVSGNLPVTNLNSGVDADSTHFWCGDGTWKVPASTSAKGGIAYFSGTPASGAVTTLTVGSSNLFDGSTSVGADKLIIGTTGVYVITCWASWGLSGSTGERRVDLKRNGGGIAIADNVANSAGFTQQFLCYIMTLNSGDQLTMTCFQTSGGAETIFADLAVVMHS